MPIRKKLPGRSTLARIAHLRSGAGAMGGTRKVKARRRRREAHHEEREVVKEPRDPKSE